MAEKKYTIEAIVSRTTLDAAGRFQKVYEITFHTPSGVRDTIEVPAKEYETKPEATIKRLNELTELHEKTFTS